MSNNFDTQGIIDVESKQMKNEMHHTPQQIVVLHADIIRTKHYNDKMQFR